MHSSQLHITCISLEHPLWLLIQVGCNIRATHGWTAFLICCHLPFQFHDCTCTASLLQWYPKLTCNKSGHRRAVMMSYITKQEWSILEALPPRLMSSPCMVRLNSSTHVLLLLCGTKCLLHMQRACWHAGWVVLLAQHLQDWWSTLAWQGWTAHHLC